MHNPKPPPVTLRPPPPMPRVPSPRPETSIPAQWSALYERLWQSEQRIEQLEKTYRLVATLIAVTATVAIASFIGVLGALYLLGEM